MRQHGVSFHQYADDTQIYLNFQALESADLEQSRVMVEACVRDIDKWMVEIETKP